jgi:hypothetical protein
MPKLAFLILVSACFISGCAPGERPFRIVQVCLGSDGGVAALREELRAIAAVEGMEFGDRSQEMAQELDSLGQGELAQPPLNAAIWRQGGPSASAVNPGMPSGQAALGFAKRGDPDAARAFSDRVVSRIRSRWRTEEVPDGEGARGMRDCAT